MRLLELFCGTKSIGKVAEELEIEVISLDNNKRHDPTICRDILDWDYKEYDKDYFDMIWASPDCTSWSIATHRHRTLPDLKPKTDIAVLGEKLIMKTLEIINYFNVEFWFIENPRGRLRHFTPMKKLPFRTTVYYGNHNYNCQKPTDIWSNIELWKEKKSERTDMSYLKLKRNKIKRSVIPEGLCRKLFSFILVDY